MVCPYCSADMEPIELSGKTFCSNCGLTIGAASPYSPAATITPFSDTDKPTGLPTTDITPLAPLEPQTPIKDSTKSEFGLPVNEPGDLIIGSGAIAEEIDDANVTTMPQEPVKVTVNTDSERPLPVDSSDEQTDSNLPPTDFTEDSEVTPTSESADYVIPSPVNEEVPSFSQTVEIPDETEFEAPAVESINNPQTNEEKIKEVDTLGASGILLDILSENYHAAEASDELKALNAAEEVLDEIETEETEEAEPAKTTDILADNLVNPVEHPELNSPLDELEITAGETEITGLEPTEDTDKEITAENEESPKENTDIDELYKLPHEITSKPLLEPDSKTEEAIEKIEGKLDKLGDPEAKKSDITSGDYDPDTLAPLTPDLIEDSPKNKPKTEEVDTALTPAAEDKDYTEKQQAIKSFFKERVEGPKKKKKGLFGSPKKTKDVKRKPSWLIIASSVIVTLVALLAIGYYFVFYSKPAASSNKTTQVASDASFASLTPSAIPEGYALTSSNFNPEKKRLTMVYNFATDETKTIQYTQTETTDPKKATLDFLDSRKGATYLVKDEGGTSFTEFASGDLVWTKDNFIFTIETANYDYAHDILYKMALSIG